MLLQYLSRPNEMLTLKDFRSKYDEYFLTKFSSG